MVSSASEKPVSVAESAAGEQSPFRGPYVHKHGKIWMPSKNCGDTFVLDVRGWGYLTGRGGGLAMDEGTAIRHQDAFGDMVAAALNAYEAPAVKPEPLDNPNVADEK